MLAPIMPVGIGPMRVIPIQSSIDGDSHSVGFEEVATILNKASRFAVADCTCRRSRRLLGEGCGHLEQDMCIQLDHGAEYYIRTGRAREISREEAFAIIRKAEENGLMHSIPNIDQGVTHAICNCCACSCYSMRNAPNVQLARHDPFELRLRGRREELRRLRPVRGALPRQRLETRAETLRRGRAPIPRRQDCP